MAPRLASHFSFAEGKLKRQSYRSNLEMLTTLRIKNLALVDDLTLELQPGYNVITGETGAGKSILIGALTLVLGQRADRTLIRDGAEACSVEAAFDIRHLERAFGDLLEKNGLEPCQDDQLTLKRAFSTNGVNRQFVNGSPTTLAILGEIGEWLVDIHGPHDHQSLLHAGQQLAILDSYGNLGAARAEFSKAMTRRAELLTEKAALIVDERTYSQQLELLRFQVLEVQGARLQPGEDQKAEQDFQRASSAARLLQLSQVSLEILSESDTSLLGQAGVLGRSLLEVQRLDSSAVGLAEMHEQAVALLGELQTALTRYADRIELEPARLQELEERLNLLQSLKRKYGPTLAEVVRFAEEAARKLQTLEQREEVLERLNTELKALEEKAWSAGVRLSGMRRKVVPQLGGEVSRQLADLGFKQSRFEVAVNTVDENQFRRQLQGNPSFLGLDAVEFQFAPNPGETIRPLRAIASSGELARVMLALKTVLANADRIPVLVFDEVDANVGGETALAVGDKMRQIARKHQVLCITHLPQVAAVASTHFLVSKEVRGGRTLSQISKLESDQRVTELARMLGGQTKESRKHAEALLKQ
jgi:DNA repair protein RecN (Recombination protein N)